MVEDLFNSIKNGFSELANRIENVHSILEKIGVSVNDSMTEISREIGNLTHALETIINVSDLKNLRESLHDIVETFRTQLDAQKVQKLLVEVSQSIKKINEKD